MNPIPIITLTLLLTLSNSLDLNNQTLCLTRPPYICALRPTTISTVTGTVILTPIFSPDAPRRKCQIRIRAKIYNLTPGNHGFHVHTYGDVTSNDGSSTGGHFVSIHRDDIPHGNPDSRRRHWGDFGNVTANFDGVAKYDRVDTVARYRAVLGRGIIVHELPDMGPAAQPSGGAGSRLASCVIGIANPDSLPF